jgi:hypothetical protein
VLELEVEWEVKVKLETDNQITEPMTTYMELFEYICCLSFIVTLKIQLNQDVRTNNFAYSLINFSLVKLVTKSRQMRHFKSAFLCFDFYHALIVIRKIHLWSLGLFKTSRKTFIIKKNFRVFDCQNGSIFHVKKLSMNEHKSTKISLINCYQVARLADVLKLDDLIARVIHVNWQ